jgi:hypothetical protein
MPQLILPIITAVIGAAGVGTSIYGLTQQPGVPDPKTTQTAVDAQAAKDKSSQEQQNQQLARRAAPDAQAQTGGSLTDTAFSDLVARLIGQPGDTTNVHNALFGGSGTEGAPGLSDAVSTLSNPLQPQEFSLTM